MPTDSHEDRLVQEWKEPERKRSILTERERRYLLGELNISGQDERNIRYNIRNRMLEGIRDLILLTDSNFQDRDMAQVLDSVDSLVAAGALSYIAYRSLDETLVDQDMGMAGDRAKDFKYLLIEIIRNVEKVIGSGGVADVNVEIDIDRGVIDEEEVWKKMIAHEATEREFSIWTHLNGYDRIHEYDGEVGFITEDGETRILNSR